MFKNTWQVSLADYQAMDMLERGIFRLCVIFEAFEVFNREYFKTAVVDGRSILLVAAYEPYGRINSIQDKGDYPVLAGPFSNERPFEPEDIAGKPGFLVDGEQLEILWAIFNIDPLSVSRADFQKLTPVVQGFLKYRTREMAGVLTEKFLGGSPYWAIVVCGSVAVVRVLLKKSEYVTLLGDGGSSNLPLRNAVEGFGVAQDRPVYVIDREGNVEAF